MANQEPQLAHCPFTLIVDTREQTPYTFREIDQLSRYGGGTLVIPILRKALETGDYSIEGMEDQVAVERKELGDFYHCCGSDRARFEKQLTRLNELKYGAMMVEADWTMIMRGHKESKLNPESVRGSVISWTMEHFPNIHWWFIGGKRTAEVMTYRILDRFWRGQPPLRGEPLFEPSVQPTR